MIARALHLAHAGPSRVMDAFGDIQGRDQAMEIDVTNDEKATNKPPENLISFRTRKTRKDKFDAHKEI